MPSALPLETPPCQAAEQRGPRRAWPWFVAAIAALSAFPLAGAFLLPPASDLAPVMAGMTGVAACILLAQSGMSSALPNADELWRVDGKKYYDSKKSDLGK